LPATSSNPFSFAPKLPVARGMLSINSSANSLS
jgi:hypothetical protein